MSYRFRTLFIALPSALALLAPVFVSAQGARGGLKNAAEGTGLTDNLNTVIADLIRAVLGFIGILFLILMVWGGVMWMTAGGNEQSIDKAKKIITGGTIGLLIVVAAYAITSFIIDNLVSPPGNFGTCETDPSDPYATCDTTEFQLPVNQVVP